MRLRVLLLLLVVAFSGLAGCGGGDEKAGGDETTASADELDPDTTYSLVLDTSEGSFTIELDQELAPNTSRSLVRLARNGFFNGTKFHRVVPGFVIQGGDPTGTGSGGPGYSTVDVPPSDAAYTEGVVAMAKTQTEAPGTAGSQFFVVTGDDIGLPPEYAIVGRVTDGMDTVKAIDALGVGRRAAVEACRDREDDGERVLIAAVVLAAGAATRFGAPKQRLLLPAVLERLDAIEEVVVVSGAYELEGAVPCPDWDRGPGASLRCGLAALGPDVEAAIVVLADGPELAPAAVERVLERWRETRAPLVAASYGGDRGHPLLVARSAWSDIPDEGLRSHEPLLVPCDDLGEPGDVDYPEDLPERFRPEPHEPM